MDSSSDTKEENSVVEESSEEQEHAEQRRGSFHRFCWGCFRLFLTILGAFFVSFLVLFAAVFVGNLPIWNPISVPSRCKIVSSSVDLRTSKVCELGLLNYKAKHVFNPHERKKFRCHYDYYWASIFKVKYVDHSGQERFGLAEAPDEALPLRCRPNFGAAWLTRCKFEVNETYDCWYTLGISKVNIDQAGLFNCQANDPSTMEMLRRYIVLSMRILQSWFTGYMVSFNYWRLDVVAGAVTGFATSLITVVLLAILQLLMPSFRHNSAVRMRAPSRIAVRMKRLCFFVAYLSFMVFITILYFKRIVFLRL